MLSPFDRSFFCLFVYLLILFFYLLLNNFHVLVFCFVFLCLFDIDNLLNISVLHFVCLYFVIK